MKTSIPILNRLTFLDQFNVFKAAVLADSDQPFISFLTGLPYDWEGYKDVIYYEGRSRLAAQGWRKKDIGSGSILQRVRDAIEIAIPKTEGTGKIINNLVDWDLRHGSAGRSHKSLLEALEDEHKWHAYESLLFDFYRNESTPEAAFNQLMKMAGKRYDFIAYLFFLKNSSQFLPISPEGFDCAFQMLEIKLRTSRRCSWENYQIYLGVLRQIRNALREESLDDVRLIDAHSFCWMLQHPNLPKTPLQRIGHLPEPLSISSVVRPHTDILDAPNRAEVGPVDWNQLREEQAALGSLAEQIVLEAERLRLENAGRSDLALAVRQVSNDHRNGYDIESFDEDGTIRFVEVKAARRNKGTISFYLTENELQKSQELDNYFLYLVFDARAKARTVKYLPASDLRPEFRKSVLHTVTIPLLTR